MADDEHLKIIKQGVEAWNAWYSRSVSILPDLAGADLSEARLSGTNFRSANLNGANLNGANLSGANLCKADLSEARLSGTNFRSANLNGANLSGANLCKAVLSEANLGNAVLSGADLGKAYLIGTDLSGADLDMANLSGAGLGKANLSEARLNGANLSGTNLSGANLSGTNLSGADLSKANLSGANLSGADLGSANLSGANLRGATFYGSNLEFASLSPVQVDTNTGFVVAGREAETKVSLCEIDAYALEDMHDFGGFLPEQRASMIIKNDLADLRESYSGLQFWIHLIALGAFMLPYAWFLMANYTKARFIEIEGAETITLWEALGRFIWNGGRNWQVGWDFDWSFLAFVFLAIYNIGRGVLLWQTNRLEHREQITSATARFSLAAKPFWRLLTKTMSVLFWVGLVVLALNTYHFMSQEVPIKPFV